MRFEGVHGKHASRRWYTATANRGGFAQRSLGSFPISTMRAISMPDQIAYLQRRCAAGYRELSSPLCIRGDGGRLRPRILHVNVTDHPTAEWTTQQFREILANPHPYRLVVHDRDSIRSSSLDQSLTDFGVRAVRTPVRPQKPTPLANGSSSCIEASSRRAAPRISSGKGGSLAADGLFADHTGLKRGGNPDAYFSLTNPQTEGKNTHHFFLEVERAKIGSYKDGEPSITRKLRRYYEYYNTAGCESDWGFRTYRVVTVLRNDERRTNLLRAMDGEHNHRMFWLGVESIRTADFRTPKGDTFSFADFW